MGIRRASLRFIVGEIYEGLNPVFVLSVLGIAFCPVLDNGDAFPLLFGSHAPGVVYYFYYSVSNGFYGEFVIPALAALPYAFSYGRDVKHNLLYASASRAGFYGYCMGKLLSAFFSAFAACACGLFLFAAFCRFFTPVVTAEYLPEFEGFPFYPLLALGGGEAYLAVLIFLQGIWSGILALGGLCLSAWTLDVASGAAAVAAFPYCLEMLAVFADVPVEWRPGGWFRAFMSPFSDGMTVVCCLALAVAAAGIFGAIFIRKVRRQFYG
ncbi:MAG: hypothetical protein HFI88_14645 [Lachnospiraceae bacterium]|nr:hypothetical protein [Lachnospiraceae bacterium]